MVDGPTAEPTSPHQLKGGGERAVKRATWYRSLWLNAVVAAFILFGASCDDALLCCFCCCFEERSVSVVTRYQVAATVCQRLLQVPWLLVANVVQGGGTVNGVIGASGHR